MLLLNFWGDSVKTAKVVAFHLKRYGFESHFAEMFLFFLSRYYDVTNYEKHYIDDITADNFTGVTTIHV